MIKELKFPTDRHQRYINLIYNFCIEHDLTLLVKGSLARGQASKYSDIDLLIAGDIHKYIDEIITIYDQPVMSNFTENPAGILILVYPDNIAVDLDIRKKITQDDFFKGLSLVKQGSIEFARKIERMKVHSVYLPERPDWYKQLRLIHKGALKYLSGNYEAAGIFLQEIKEEIEKLGIKNLDYSGRYNEDISVVFQAYCNNFMVDMAIVDLFTKLFKEMNDVIG